MMIRLTRSEIDIDTYDWPYRDQAVPGIYPPLVAEIDNTFRLLSRFDGPPADDTYLLVDAKTPVQALNASIDSYGVNTINLIEASNIAAICADLGVDIDKIHVFDVLRIRNRKYFEALHAMQKLPDGLKRYIAAAALPPRILTVISELPDRLFPVLEGFIGSEHPKPESFSRFVHLLADFAEAIDCACYDPAAIKRATGADARRISLLGTLGDIAAELHPVVIEPDTESAGTAGLKVSFTVDSPADFERKVADLGEKSDAIRRIYGVMDEADDLPE